jgi:hypothetical protein
VIENGYTNNNLVKKLGVASGKLLHNELERSTMLFMGKSTISTGPFSIAMSVYYGFSYSFPMVFL